MANKTKSTGNSGKNTEKRGRVENLKPWRPGQSGNPSGRPKKRLIDEVLAELLEASDSKEAMAIGKALIKKAKSGDPRCAQLISERTQGKPKQSIEHEINDKRPILLQHGVSRPERKEAERVQ